MLAEIGREEHPDRDPKRRTYGIEQDETPPGHSQHSRHDTVELTQNAEEACEQHRRGAVANILIFDLAKAFIGKTDFCAVAQDSLSSDVSADQEAQIVAYDSAYPAKNEQGRQGHLAATRQN